MQAVRPRTTNPLMADQDTTSTSNTSQPVMGFRVTGKHAELSNPEDPDELLWMSLPLLSRYHEAYPWGI